MLIMERVVFLTVLIASTVAPPPSTSHQYRTDYEYNSITDAFYKLHIDTVPYIRAKTACFAEGAVLVIPNNKQDLVQIHGMIKKFPDLGQLVWVGDDGEKHESAEEEHIIDLTTENYENVGHNCDVVNRKAEIETTMCYNRLPFVCKVEAKDASYDSQCGTYGSGYQYYSSVHSCYKVSRVGLTWNEAFAECKAEGSHLIVLNSEAESIAVKELLNTAPRVPESQTSYFFFAGIRAERPTGGTQRTFKTIFNETLEEAGFALWSDGEPNNYMDTEYCGTIFSNNGKYNDANCLHTFAFVCEKEVRWRK